MYVWKYAYVNSATAGLLTFCICTYVYFVRPAYWGGGGGESVCSVLHLNHFHIHTFVSIIIPCNAWLHHFLLASLHVYHVPHTCTIPFMSFAPLFLFVYVYVSVCIYYCIHSFVQYMNGSSDIL